jgi:UDP-glucuronate 4-epimerase
MRFFVTGSAGFIGFNLCRRLLSEGHVVDGFDAMTTYYDVTLKERRHALLAPSPHFRAHIERLENMDALQRAVETAQPDIVVHLAAQAGVRYSLENPRAYVEANLVGTFNLMECVRQRPVDHLVLASTSSVYGGNERMPFIEHERTDHPLTLYAATKKATEDMAHSYAHLWRQATTMLRFFTVYGPWGRPDMALFKFADAIMHDRPIDIYNSGDMKRDFTYIDDLVESIVRICARAPQAAPEGDWDLSHSPTGPYRVVNIGGGAPVGLLEFIEEIERALGRKAIRNYMPMQMGDVPATFSDSTLLQRLTGYTPSTPVRDGVSAFLDWYRDYYTL